MKKVPSIKDSVNPFIDDQLSQFDLLELKSTTSISPQQCIDLMNNLKINDDNKQKQKQVDNFSDIGSLTLQSIRFRPDGLQYSTNTHQNIQLDKTIEICIYQQSAPVLLSEVKVGRANSQQRTNFNQEDQIQSTSSSMITRKRGDHQKIKINGNIFENQQFFGDESGPLSQYGVNIFNRKTITVQSRPTTASYAPNRMSVL